MLTFRTYAHAIREEEADLSFADFGDSKRLDTSPGSEDDTSNDNAPGASDRGRYEYLERETGIEPATLSLGRRKRDEQ